MIKNLMFCLLVLFLQPSMFCHEEHKKNNQEQEVILPSKAHSFDQYVGRPLTWSQWFGSFHFIFLHFPIALITMTGVSEFLLARRKKVVYNFAAKFMITSAAILIIPTALTGILYRYETSYSGLLAEYISWHMVAGIITTFLTIFVAFIRQVFGVSKYYYCSLFVLFLLVNITGYLGGCMTFGPYYKYFPLSN